jgi:sugar O-acyltransferase (sialic acid O-acetyltransferase NeuD family)
MSHIEILAPRLNANEDELLVKSIDTAVGDKVEAGQILFTVETTKAAVEIEAAAAGEIAKIVVEPGRMIQVGDLMALLSTGAGESASGETSDSEGAQDGPVKITAKAKILAKELGVDLDTVAAVNGRIGMDEVRRAAKPSDGKPANSSDTALGTRLTPNQAVVFGGGGHAATIAEVAIAAGWDLVGAIDDGLDKGTTVIDGLEVIGDTGLLQSLYDSGVRTAFVGIGGATLPDTRIRIFSLLKDAGFSLPPLVDPSAHLGAGVKLGEATYVLPAAMLGPRCRIGSNVIVNSGSIVAHDCVIEDHVHLTPGAILAGNVTVGERSVIGMGASVLFGCSVGRNCLVHNTVSVVLNVPDDTELTHKGHA